MTNARQTAAAEKAEATHAQLVASLEALTTSEDWTRYLDVAAKFHSYSAGNVALILAQRSSATRVAGFKAWQGLGRQVRKGEKGLAILAPMVYKREADDGTIVRGVRGFRVVHVFDVAQTDGEPLADVRPVLLDGDGPAGMWAALAAQVAAAGFELVREPSLPANGWTRFGTRQVNVDPSLSPAQAAKTLAHELAHALLHDESRVTVERAAAEVEAESVAYIVCQAAGLVTEGYSLPYVATWAAGSVETVKATAGRVIKCAHQILEALAGADAGGPEVEVEAVEAA